MKEFLYLIQKDLTLELKQKHLVGSVLLYLAGILYIINFLFQEIQVQTWTVLFWIIVLFSSIQLSLKGYFSEGKGVQMMYYQLAAPETIYLSKWVYNTILIVLIEVLCTIGFHLISPIRLESYGVFSIVLLLAAMGLSGIMSFTSILVSHAPIKSTLVSILSIPLILPILLESIQLTATVLGFIEDTSRFKDFTLLLAIDILILSVGLSLFPYLWRE